MAVAVACESIRSVSRGWRAQIDLEAELVPPRTILRSAKHHGPLRVQRAFYPEPDGTCHLLLLHPPGGVVGGDELEVNLRLKQGANLLLTTPGATKIYRCEQSRTQLSNHIHVGTGGRCEWLPQETILFNGAATTLSTQVQLEGTANFIGWDVLCFGRPFAQECFDRGKIVSNLEIYRDGHMLFNERLVVRGDSPILEQAWGLDGTCVIGTLLIAAYPSPQVTVALREVLERFKSELPAPRDDTRAGVRSSGSELEDVFVFRTMGTSAEAIKRELGRAWQLTRRCFGADGNYSPRIWAT